MIKVAGDQVEGGFPVPGHTERVGESISVEADRKLERVVNEEPDIFFQQQAVARHGEAEGACTGRDLPREFHHRPNEREVLQRLSTVKADDQLIER